MHEPIDADLDSGAGQLVSQAVDPVPVDGRHPDAQGESVSYRLRLSSGRPHNGTRFGLPVGHNSSNVRLQTNRKCCGNKKSQSNSAPSLGSRWYLRRARVGATTRSAWDRAQHEPRKQPLRQRCDGKLLQHRTEAHDDWKHESNQTRIELADASEMDIIKLSTKVKQAQAHATPSQLLASPLASNSVWRAVHVLVLWRAHVSDLRRP